MVRADPPRAREPERSEAGEHATLVGNRGRQDDIEGGDAVGGDEEQVLVVERVQLPDLAASEVNGVSHASLCTVSWRTPQDLSIRVAPRHDSIETFSRDRNQKGVER